MSPSRISNLVAILHADACHLLVYDVPAPDCRRIAAAVAGLLRQELEELGCEEPVVREEVGR